MTDENTMYHTSTTIHEFIDPQSGNSMEVRATDDNGIGIILNGNEDESLWMTVEQLRPVADVMQGIIGSADTHAMLEALQGEVSAIRESADAMGLRFDLPAGHPNSVHPRAEDQPTIGVPYSDPSEASQYDMAEWNLDALEYAEMNAAEVTFTYQGANDSYARQRRVGDVMLAQNYHTLVTNGVYAEDRDDNDQVKQFRLDRIKSHVLVLGA